MVIGLLIVFGLALYLLISVALVIWATRYARRRGRSGWKWGLLTALMMYLLVFWDWIPTVVMFRHECSTRAGFTVYKTLDAWKREHPGVAETLRPIKDPQWQTVGNRRRIPLNQRFSWDTITTPHPFYIREREERIVDIKTGEVLARYIDFYTDFTTRREVRNFHDLKVWMSWGSCPRGGYPDMKWLKNGDSFKGWLVRFKNVGEEQ